MELHVQLKICEGCGSLWYRTLGHRSVYCKGCETRLREFPLPETRKRRGRPSAAGSILRLIAVAEATGGVQ